MTTYPTLPLPERTATPALPVGQVRNGAIPPEWLGLIRVEGPDAAVFLQSQFTSDVAALATDRWQWTGYCSPKGRLLAVARLMRDAPGFHIELPLELRDDLVARLRRFVMRSKATLAPVEGWCTVNLDGDHAGAAATQALDATAPGDRMVLSRQGLVMIGGDGATARVHFDPAAQPRLAAILAAVPADAVASEWRSADLRAGIPWIVAATQDAFVPQMVDLDAIGGVSFAKGCYPGQEIVARSRYLGEVKRRLHLGRSTAAPAPGDSIQSAGQAVGKVLASARSDTGGFDVLAVIDTEAAKGNALDVAGARLVDVRRVRSPEEQP